jgi:cysteine-rich repeat protein
MNLRNCSRSLTSVFLAGLILAPGCTCGGDTGYITPTNPIISTNTDLLDFGEIPVQIEVVRRLTVLNSGQLELTISEKRLEDSNDVFSIDGSEIVIDGESDAILPVHFLPTATGFFQAEITLISNAANQEELVVMLQGTGVDDTICGSCESPPVAHCISEELFVYYESSGTCVDGQCEYQSYVIECEEGCDEEADQCRTPQPFCGDEIVNGDEVCDDGNAVDGDGCDSNCTTTGCGNGILTSGETCDDGNLVDGDGCDSNCTTSECGNQIVAGDEECDNGDANSDAIADACRTDCTLAGCGDGVVDTGESCDDMNVDNTDSCISTCQLAACGDGYQHIGHEECDHGQNNDDTLANACRTNCLLPHCGDNVIDATEACDNGEDNSDTDSDACRTNCVNAFCGDGVIDTPDSCDDGNLDNTDACLNNCANAACGDGFIHIGTEDCDDGGLDDGDGCSAMCLLPSCGDGITDMGEECDDQNATDGDGCDTNCTNTACGNGVITAGEFCDDGNIIDGDGCDSNCTETGCGNGVITEGEDCDDGNTDPGDACPSDCTTNPPDICEATTDCCGASCANTWELVLDGTFDDLDASNNPSNWVIAIDTGWSTGTETIFKVLATDDPHTNVAEFVNTSSGASGRWDWLYQYPSLDVSNCNKLAVSFDAKVMEQNLSGGGFTYGEFPAHVRIWYEDADGNDVRWQYGVYSDGTANENFDCVQATNGTVVESACPEITNGRCCVDNTLKVSANTWQSIQDIDLMQLDPKPVVINRIIIGSSGWAGRQGRFDNISVLASEPKCGQ